MQFQNDHILKIKVQQSGDIFINSKLELPPKKWTQQDTWDRVFLKVALKISGLF